MRLPRIHSGLLLLGAVILGCARGIPEGGVSSPPRTAPLMPAPGEGKAPSLTMPPLSSAAEEGIPSGGEVLSLEGVIEAVIPGGYQVAGHRVRVSSEIDSEGPLPPGIYVSVLGSRAPDGSLVAESFEVLRRPGAEGEWEGTIQEVLPHGYRVDGRRVFVLPTTEVMGTPQIGQDVYLSGFEQPDGSIIADSLMVLESP